MHGHQAVGATDVQKESAWPEEGGEGPASGSPETKQESESPKSRGGGWSWPSEKTGLGSLEERNSGPPEGQRRHGFPSQSSLTPVAVCRKPVGLPKPSSHFGVCQSPPRSLLRAISGWLLAASCSPPRDPLWGTAGSHAQSPPRPLSLLASPRLGAVGKQARQGSALHPQPGRTEPHGDRRRRTPRDRDLQA